MVVVTLSLTAAPCSTLLWLQLDGAYALCCCFAEVNFPLCSGTDGCRVIVLVFLWCDQALFAQKVFYSLSGVICSQTAISLIFECSQELGDFTSCSSDISACPVLAHAWLLVWEWEVWRNRVTAGRGGSLLFGGVLWQTVQASWSSAAHAWPGAHLQEL